MNRGHTRAVCAEDVHVVQVANVEALTWLQAERAHGVLEQAHIWLLVAHDVRVKHLFEVLCQAQILKRLFDAAIGVGDHRQTVAL